MSEQNMWYREFAAILKEEFGPLGFNVATAEAPGEKSHQDTVSNEQAKKVLGI